MACVQLPPFPPLPSLGPLSLDPPALPPLPGLDIDFCCKLSIFITLPPLPFGPLVLAIPGASAVVAAINVELAIVEAYLDALPLSCPFDP